MHPGPGPSTSNPTGLFRFGPGGFTFDVFYLEMGAASVRRLMGVTSNGGSGLEHLRRFKSAWYDRFDNFVVDFAVVTYSAVFFCLLLWRGSREAQHGAIPSLTNTLSFCFTPHLSQRVSSKSEFDDRWILVRHELQFTEVFVRFTHFSQNCELAVPCKNGVRNIAESATYLKSCFYARSERFPTVKDDQVVA